MDSMTQHGQNDTSWNKIILPWFTGTAKSKVTLQGKTDKTWNKTTLSRLNGMVRDKVTPHEQDDVLRFPGIVLE